MSDLISKKCFFLLKNKLKECGYYNIFKSKIFSHLDNVQDVVRLP